jgi:hypothetical protein
MDSIGGSTCGAKAVSNFVEVKKENWSLNNGEAQ